MTRRTVLKGAKLNLCHAVLAVAVLSCLAPLAAHAQSMESQATFNIQAGDLASAVDAFSQQSGLQVLYRPELLGGKKAKSVSGALTNAEALERLLKDSGIRWERVNGSTYVLKESKKAPDKQRTSIPPVSNPASSSQEESIAELEKLVVVGSRLGSSPVESAMPIKVITRDQIERSGAGNIAQVISYLSEVSINNSGDRPIGNNDGISGNGNTNSSTVQMRGLPRGTTLVLINGRRAGETAAYSDTGQFDLSTVPLSLVERIEVLPAGSSAVYGGDALAGVVNIVLRQDVSGLELRARNSASDGYETKQIGIMWGKTWERGDLSISATWRESGALYNDERSLTSDQDYRRFGGRDYRTASSYPATVYSLAGCPAAPTSCFRIPVANRGNLPGLDSPVAVVPEGSTGIGLTPEDFRATQGQRNLTSGHYHFRSREENYSINSSGRFKLGDKVEAFAELMYSKRIVPAYQNLLTLTSGSSGLLYSRIPADHPFNPFGVEVGVDFRFKNTGLFTEYSQTHTRGVLGLKGTVSRFEWEVSGWQARDEGVSSGGAGFNSDALMAAVNSKDPAQTFNPFASDGSLPASTELMQSWLFNLNQRSTSRVTGLTGTVRGTLAELPVGKMVGLVGVEQQKFIVSRDTNNMSYLIPNLDAKSTNKAYFAETRVPVMSARPGDSFERVAVTGAFRQESSDRFDEDAKTKTFGLEIRPFQSLLLRATYSTAFKPPLTFTSAELPFTYVDFVLDPRFGGDAFDVTVESGGGISPGLRPETSDNTTFGLLYRPSSLWSVSLTHWDIEFIDRMTVLD
ncbi:MAG: TonB-dependent receptor domain-containing protein, partial [Pseudonocardiaceae bacterium]